MKFIRPTDDQFGIEPAAGRIPVSVLQTSEPVTEESKRGHILLADDDVAVREMLGRVLASEGYRVSAARGGLQAVHHFIQETPDLVLLDLNMPDLDGWGAFGRMCARDLLVPVIVITARPHQQERALELGVDALMEKPLDLPVLLREIRKLLAETETERTRRLINPKFRTEFLNLPAASRNHA